MQAPVFEEEEADAAAEEEEEEDGTSSSASALAFSTLLTSSAFSPLTGSPFTRSTARSSFTVMSQAGVVRWRLAGGGMWEGDVATRASPWGRKGS